MGRGDSAVSEKDDELIVIEEKAGELMLPLVEGLQSWDRATAKLQDDVSKTVAIMIGGIRRAMAQVRDYNPYIEGQFTKAACGAVIQLEALGQEWQSLKRKAERNAQLGSEEYAFKYDALAAKKQTDIAKIYIEFTKQTTKQMEVAIGLMNSVTDRQERARQHDERMHKDASNMSMDELEKAVGDV